MTAQHTIPSRTYWLPLAALIVHVLEELPRFPAWATARFGTTTTTWYVVSHIPLLALVVYISWRAALPSRSDRALWWLMVLLWALFANALFHIGASIYWSEYSPGLVSAVVIYVPMTCLLTPRLAGALGNTRTVRAGVFGVLISVGFAATLWLDIPVGSWES